MCEYKITISGEYDMIVLSPKMIALLIDKIRSSGIKELAIPAQEFLPWGYVSYLARVLEANMQTESSNANTRDIYELVINQIKNLSINHQKCFDEADLEENQYCTQFHLCASEPFYTLVNQKTVSFTFISMLLHF